MRADWVYRGGKYLLAGDIVNDEEERESGTYYAPFTLASSSSGVPSEGATAQVLYDSEEYMGSRYAPGQVPASGQWNNYAINAQARPDAVEGGPLIHAVDVNFHVFNSTWATGWVLYLGVRVIVAQQDPLTGLALLDPAYSMWQDVAGLTAQPATWANGRDNCWEDRITKVFRTSDGGQLAFYYKARPRFKRRLKADEGLFLYFETHPSSGDIGLINPFCRTLVTDTRR